MYHIEVDMAYEGWQSWRTCTTLEEARKVVKEQNNPSKFRIIMEFDVDEPQSDN